jgi:carboxylate-amine ligase
VQTLARREAEAPRSELPPAEAIAWSCFRAARDGLDAEILYEGEIVPARLALAGLGVPEVAPLLAEGGASRRRAAHARGGVEEMLRELVAETAA